MKLVEKVRGMVVLGTAEPALESKGPESRRIPYPEQRRKIGFDR
jgi:hypothetical protein